MEISYFFYNNIEILYEITITTMIIIHSSSQLTRS
jgi:hypothetical protein